MTQTSDVSAGIDEPMQPIAEPAGPMEWVVRRLGSSILAPVDDSSEAAIRGELEQSADELAPHFLEQARLRYDDVFKRLENVERRAGTLQTSIVFAVTLTLTGGALLLDAAKVPNESWRSLLALTMLVAVALFARAGLHASLAGVRLEAWEVVGKQSLQGEVFTRLTDAQRHRAAAYLWCINHNMAVNRWKADQLYRGLRSFLAGLAALVLVAALLTAYVLVEAPTSARAADVGGSM